jgi:hypothetical protein
MGWKRKASNKNDCNEKIIYLGCRAAPALRGHDVDDRSVPYQVVKGGQVTNDRKNKPNDNKRIGTTVR